MKDRWSKNRVVLEMHDAEAVSSRVGRPIAVCRGHCVAVYAPVALRSHAITAKV